MKTEKKVSVSDWLLLKPNWAIIQLYHAWWEQVTFQSDDDDVSFVLDRHAQFVF